MKVCKRYMKCLFVFMVVCFPYFSIASRKDETCVNVDFKQGNGCDAVSNNYKQPFCITNVLRNSSDKDVTNASTCISFISTNKFSNSNVGSTSDLINLYCSSLFGESNEGRIYFAVSSSETDDVDWKQTFDSHQSLFLYALCSSFRTKSGKTPFVKSNGLLKDVYKGDIVKLLNLQQISNGEDLCALKDDNSDSLDDCDLSIYVTKIFEGIMSDLFKIEYAQVLHVNAVENFETKKKVEEFMKGYFSFSEGYNDIKKNYSKTVSILEGNQKFYKDVLNSLKIIDNSKLASLAENSNCSGNVTGMEFVACALHSHQGKGPSLTPSFVTLVYNELLHYRHFVTYYSNAMQLKGKETGKLEYEVKRLDFQEYSDMQVEALKLAQNNFEEFSMTYPLHIWILLYAEKIEKFRNNSLSKVIPIFYSLSEKLQNVQEPSS